MFAPAALGRQCGQRLRHVDRFETRPRSVVGFGCGRLRRLRVAGVGLTGPVCSSPRETQRQPLFGRIGNQQTRLDKHDAARRDPPRPHRAIAELNRSQRGDRDRHAFRIGKANVAQLEFEAGDVCERDRCVLDIDLQARQLGLDRSCDELGDELQRDRSVEQADVDEARAQAGEQHDRHEHAQDQTSGSEQRSRTAPP